FWVHALTALAQTFEPTAPLVDLPLRELEKAAAETRHPSLVRFGRAIAAELLLSKGRREEARKVLEEKSLWVGAPERDLLLRDQIRVGIADIPSGRLTMRIAETG